MSNDNKALREWVCFGVPDWI